MLQDRYFGYQKIKFSTTLSLVLHNVFKKNKRLTVSEIHQSDYPLTKETRKTSEFKYSSSVKGSSNC